MKRYSREEMLAETGARPEELAQLETQRTLVPNRTWSLFGKKQEYYTAGQLEVLRLIVRTRRAIEASRRACLPAQVGDGPGDH